MDTAPEGLRDRKRRATTARIEDAAIQLFERKGFDDTTVDDIASAAEVSRATVFRYFGSKDDIVYGVESELLDHLRRLVRDPRVSLADAAIRYAEHVDANHPDLRRRSAVIAMTPRLFERLGHIRIRWEVAVAHDLAKARGGRAGPSLQDHVEAAAVVSSVFIAFLNWSVTPNARLTPLVRRAIEVVPTKLVTQATPRPDELA